MSRHDDTNRTMADLRARLGLNRGAASRRGPIPKINLAPEVALDDKDHEELDKLIANLPPEVREKAEQFAIVFGIDLKEVLLLAATQPEDFEKITAAAKKSSPKKLDAATLVELATVFITSYDERIRPFVDAAKQLEPQAAQEIASIIGVVADLVLDAADGLKDQRVRGYKMAAETRKGKLDAYIAAGFTAEQAFGLVLAEVKPPDYSGIQKSVSEAASKINQKG